MIHHQSGLRLAVILLAVFLASSCNNPRRLEAVIVRPVSPDAQDFPNGKVKFTATGMFNKPPLAVTPLPVKWTTGLWWNGPPSSNITIDNQGEASCNRGFSGAASVMAFAPADPSLAVSQITQGTRLISATAQLICP